MTTTDLDMLPLHDATLATVTIDWPRRSCTLVFTLVHDLGQRPSRGELTFVGLRRVSLPFEEPWGPSNSVNGASTPEPGVFIIELQSGDRLELLASGFTWSAS